MRRALFLIGIVLILIGVGIYFQSTKITCVEHDYITSLVNEYRKENKLPCLTETEKLDEIVQERAKLLVEEEQWSHERFKEFMESKDIHGEYGENLARNIDDDKVVELWMDSQKHKENLINPDDKYIGIGRYGNIIVLIVGH